MAKWLQEVNGGVIVGVTANADVAAEVVTHRGVPVLAKFSVDWHAVPLRVDGTVAKVLGVHGLLLHSMGREHLGVEGAGWHTEKPVFGP